MVGLFVMALSLAPSPLLIAQVHTSKSEILLAQGRACLEDEEFHLATHILTEAVEELQPDNNAQTAVDAYFFLAQAKYWLADYQASNENLYSLLNDHAKKLSHEDSLAILRLVSQNHYYMGNYDLAHEIALNRLKLTEAFKDSHNIGLSYQVLSEIEVRQKDYRNALEHIKVSSAIFERMGLLVELSYNLDLMGDILHNTGKYEEALSYKIRSCQIVDTTGSIYDNAYCNHTIAVTLGKMGRHQEAMSLFNLALANWEKAGMSEEKSLTKACLGETLALSGKCDQGISLMKTALKEAEKMSISPLRRDVLEKLFQVNKHCGEIEPAFHYLEKYIAINDSLSNQNTKVRIASLSSNYELEKKNSELQVLHQKERVKMQFIIFLLIGFVFLFGAALLGYYLLKKQRDYSQQLDAKTKQIERQYEDIHHTNEKLKGANKELEQFAYLASHDLKAPLRTIGNYASLINRRYSSQLDQDGVAFLRFITEAAKHMNDLLEDIFTYSKLGKSDLEITEVNLQEKLDLSLRLLHETIESRKATVKYDQLPVIAGNPTQLYQLIQNLLDNALKFVPEGRSPEVSIKTTDNGSFYHLQVTDNGVGIPKNKQEEVFTIFKRLHSRDEYKGTGIGLAICKKIVEAHGGRIWIVSDGEIGTTFHFTLKKAIDAPQAIAA